MSRARRLSIGLLASIAAVAASACGRSDLLLEEGGGEGTSSGATPGGSGSSSGAASSGTGQIPSSGSVGASSGSSSPCSPSFFEDPVPASIGGCWACVEKACAVPLMECAADCTCNQAIKTALSCVAKGGSAVSCFTPELMGLTASPALAMCLLQGNGECGACGETDGGDTVTMAPDASPAGCVPGGNGATAGGGSCSSTITETCGGTVYQAVCACPEARCVCFGDTTTVVPISGCPYCPNAFSGVPGEPPEPGALTTDQVFSLCGFPR
jgi:hypothetical protein